MSKTIQCKIVTPERVVFEDMVDEVILPAADGEIAVLPNHIPLVTLMRAGVLRVKKGSEDQPLSVSTGIVEIDGKRVIILADTAERADELEEEKIERAREAAKRLMEEKRHDVEGFAEASAALDREIARMKVLKRHRRSKESRSL